MIKYLFFITLTISTLLGAINQDEQNLINEFSKKLNSNNMNIKGISAEVINNTNNDLLNTLKESLDNDTYNAKEFQDSINKVFVDNFKESATNFINNDQLLSDEQKNKIIDEMNNYDNLGAIGDYFNELDVSVENSEGEMEQWQGSDTLSDSEDSVSQEQQQTNYTFNCECSDALEDAFESMNEHIIVNNLNKIPGALDGLKDKIEDVISKYEEQDKVLSQQEQAYAVKIAYAKLVLQSAKDELYKVMKRAKDQEQEK